MFQDKRGTVYVRLFHRGGLPPRGALMSTIPLWAQLALVVVFLVTIVGIVYAFRTHDSETWGSED